jgi:monofunctional glycosyltransferase
MWLWAMKQVLRLIFFFILSLVCLQLYFGLRIVAMNWIDLESTSFQRAEAGRLLLYRFPRDWKQIWVPYSQISSQLQRAVIASEDAGFIEHSGVQWDAVEKAWEKNLKAQDRAQRSQDQPQKRQRLPPQRISSMTPKIVGGSTITQQLAKNIFLSAERNLFRKSQELIITMLLENLLSKQRILELYLNNVEWGEGIFGAQAAAQHYFRIDAAKLAPLQAARLAVLLPAPKRFEKRPRSAYLLSRAVVVAARMPAVELP